MAGEHGGGGHSVGHESKSHQNIVGEIKPMKLLFDVLDKTIDGVFATPIAQVGLDAVEGVGKVVEGGANLGSPSGGGGGGGHGGGKKH